MPSLAGSAAANARGGATASLRSASGRPARPAVARFFGLKQLGSGLDLVLTSGADEGIRLVCECFVRPGEKVVLLDPAFSMYRFCATLSAAEVKEVPYKKDDLSFPEEELRAEVRKGARLVILPDPNNPTGTPAPPGFAEELAGAAPKTLFLVDEAYAEFSSHSSIPSLPRRPNLLVARTFSKAYGLAGVRAGVLMGDGRTLSWIGRIRNPYSVNSLALIALVAALEDHTYAQRCAAEAREGRALMAEELERLGIRCYPSQANFLLARFGDRSVAVRESLRSQGILVKQIDGHPLLEGALRIAIGTPEEVDRLLRAVKKALDEANAPDEPLSGGATRPGGRPDGER
ncbi:MAG: histidinol-phosphate transaminase [Acidobacteria bacterium]|nr:MAG: histidinol-phosphate transaminase [Acidobacteriota bacterium]